MLAQLMVAAVATVAASALIGHALHTQLGAKSWRWTSPAVGFGALVTLMATSSVLPGRVLAPAAVAGALAVVGGLHLARNPDARPAPSDLVSLLAPLGAALLPFLAAGRVGILGVSFNNDTAAHLLLAEHVHNGALPDIAPWYPLGPHGVVGLLIALGIPGAVAVTAFTIAIPVITAATARSLLDGLAWPARALTMLLTSVPYLVASYIAQGAFKEVTMAMFLVAVAALLEETRGLRSDWRYVPIAVVLAGVVSTYSYLGVAWPVAAILLFVCWHSASVIRRGGPAELGTQIGHRFFSAGTAFVALVAMLALQLPRVQRFYDWNTTAGIAADNFGNLPGPISPRSMLGIWLGSDFRFPSPYPGLVEALGLLVATLVLIASADWLRQRKAAVPLAGLAALAIALAAQSNQSPYTVAKAFVIVSPFPMLILGRTLGDAATRWPTRRRLAPIALGVVIAGTGFWGSGLALRGAQVGPSEHSEQLERLRNAVDGRPTLYLGLNDYIQWELRGTPVTQPLYGVLQVKLRPEKSWEYGQSFDTDSLADSELDRFTFVVSPRIETDSAMPENFRQVAATKDFVVHQRTGKTRPRRVLSEGENGTAILDCSTERGRAIVDGGGVAAIRPPLVTVPLSAIPPRSQSVVELPLSRGTWDLSLRYLSSRAITLRGPNFRARVPAALERAGSVWPAGSIKVTTARPTALTLQPDYRAAGVDAATAIMPSAIIAQRRGLSQTVPVAQACGRAVDWYRPGAAKETP